MHKIINTGEKDMPVFRIDVMWDEEASVWVATSEDVPGLVAEADTQPEMLTELRTLIPILIEANQVDVKKGEVPIELLYQRTDRVNIDL